MTWTQLTVDISAASSCGLNLIGHSTAVSPVNPTEIFIFGGRRSDENSNTNHPPIPSRLSTPPVATLWTLNIETATLVEAPLRLPKDLSNLPEARLNQLFLRRNEEPVALKPPPPVTEESKSGTGSHTQGRKGKSSRRAPALPVKRPKLQPHAVLTLFGGSKLYSSGFCGGMFHEIFFVPLEKKESSWGSVAAEMAAAGNDSVAEEVDLQSLPDRDMDTRASHRFSTMSAVSAAGSTIPRRMSSLQIMMESQSDPEEIFHMMNIKENSVTKLSSPKRGVGAHYFAVKTQLSRSRSTFSRPGSGIPANTLPDIRGIASSPSRRPISAPSTLFHDQPRVAGWENHPTPAAPSTSGESPTQLSRRQDSREKIKTMSEELCPLVKGLSLHEARQVFQRLHPSTAAPIQDPWTAPAPLHASSSAPLLHQTSFNPSLSHLTSSHVSSSGHHR
jgi:hypothetical protein